VTSATPPFAVGDKVTTDYRGRSKEGVFEVYEVGVADGYGSGWYVSLAPSAPCPTCGHVRYEGVYRIDSAWCRKVAP